MVDSYIDGQKSLAAEYQGELYSYAGGEENYEQMSEWATENMSDDEIDAYNDAIVSGNPSQAKLAIEALHSRYVKENGSAPSLVGGKASSSVDTYASWAQVTADMAKPEYKKDPAYRQAVSNKLARVILHNLTSLSRLLESYLYPNKPFGSLRRTPFLASSD